MKSLLFFAILYLIFDGISAHYLFGHLLVNDTKTEQWQYVRNVTANETYISGESFGILYPQYGKDLDTTNFTCGRDAFKFATKTATATVIAGSEIGFRVARIGADLPEKYQNSIFHDGPAYIYMAKAPNDNLESFLGDEGNWFKIASYLAKNATAWIINKSVSDVSGTIPASTPPGKYLLRVEQFAFSPYPQFYVNCAHVNVVGPGGGTPTQFAKFPGTYKYTEIENAYRKGNYLDYPKNFTGIGPLVWSG